mgnify:CR=1 FL=1
MGIGDESNDVTLLQTPAGRNAFERVGMSINRQQPAMQGFSVNTNGVLDHNGPAQVVLEHSPDNTVEQNRNSRLRVESTPAMGPVPVKAEVQAFVREVPLTKIAPPFIRGAEQHSGMKHPAAEIVQNGWVGIDGYLCEWRRR